MHKIADFFLHFFVDGFLVEMLFITDIDVQCPHMRHNGYNVAHTPNRCVTNIIYNIVSAFMQGTRLDNNTNIKNGS